MADADSIAMRLERVQADLEEAAAAAGRSSAPTLIAVSKTVAPERIREAYEAGQRIFGENRVQEGVTKIEGLQPLAEAEWHLIGNLQTNKVNAAVRWFAWVQSVDSLKLAQKLQNACARDGIVLPILLEINVAGEASKAGFDPQGVEQALKAMLQFDHLHLRGLMTVAPLAGDPEDVRWVFRTLREMRDVLRERYDLDGFTELSMGMSGDYEVAVKEGATIVRIGRAIFGDRPALRG